MVYIYTSLLNNILSFNWVCKDTNFSINSKLIRIFLLKKYLYFIDFLSYSGALGRFRIAGYRSLYYKINDILY